MNAQFISINLPKQRIKLNVEIVNNISDKKSFEIYKYNHQDLFFYNVNILESKVNLKLCLSDKKIFFNRRALGYFTFDICKKYSISDLQISCESGNILEEAIVGFLQKDYVFTKYKSKSPFRHFELKNYKLSKKNQNFISSIELLKELVSEPSNIIYPDTFAKKIQKKINLKNVNIKILNKKNIEKIGLDCLLAVNQGSAREPRVIEFSKKNFEKKNVDILFVGKGVCFDTGGISIKPSAGMEDMKWDMAGAAVTASIINYLSNLKTNFTYAGIVGLVENMPSGTAYKPGDIIKSYKGINVEVLNTDAEGRLVLADIITYGCEIYKPKIVIDFATLTGAIMVALGQHYAGMFSNDDDLSEALYKSGIETNEKVWRMPLHDDFDKELNSPFVDLKNIGAGRYGGSVTAAQFLQRFVPPKTKWAHLDIAGTTWKNSGDMQNSKGATGFGLTLIADFIDRYFKN